MSGEKKRGRWALIKGILSLFLLLLFTVWAVYYIYSHRSDFTALRDVSLVELAGIYALSFIAIWIRGYFTLFLTAPFGARVSRVEAFFISLVTTVGNYALPMRGGVGLTALYLKRKHAIGYRDFAKISLARFSTIFLIDSLLGLLAVFVLWESEGVFNRPILIVLVIALVVSGLIHIAASVPLGDRWRFLTRWIGGSTDLLKTKGVTKVVVGIALLNSAVRVLWILGCFHAISISLSFYQALLLSSLIPLSMVVTLTPGNLGITEGLLIYVSRIFGVGPSSAIMCALLMRSSVIFWSVLMIPFLRKPYRLLKGALRSEDRPSPSG